MPEEKNPIWQLLMIMRKLRKAFMTKERNIIPVKGFMILTRDIYSTNSKYQFILPIDPMDLWDIIPFVNFYNRWP